MVSKIFKKENGSITLFVLLSCLFFLVVVTSVSVSLKNNSSSIDAEYTQIKENYEKSLENIDGIYEEVINNEAIINNSVS